MKRTERLAEKLRKEGLDGVLLINDSNIRYISGFTGSESYVIISERNRFFVTDSRYTEQAEAECKDFEVIRWGKGAKGLHDTLKEVCEKAGIKRLAFERQYVTYDMHEKLSKALEGVELVPAEELVEELRCVKDDTELDYMRKAAQIADEAFAEILKYIKPGVTEMDIERELQYFIKKKGAEDVGFPTIIASGKRSSLPHAIPADRRIEKGDFVTLDFGAKYMGYRSDMTRTVVVGAPTDKQREIYEIVKKAQEDASKAIRPGVAGKVPDACARECIGNAGYGEYFGHGLGHGVGLDIHEGPGLSLSSERLLEEANVVTVEPGIYLPDWGGVRIEDTVVVTAEGIEVLTKSTKDLIIIE